MIKNMPSVTSSSNATSWKLLGHEHPAWCDGVPDLMDLLSKLGIRAADAHIMKPIIVTSSGTWTVSTAK